MNKQLTQHIKIGGIARVDTDSLINTSNTLSEIEFKALLFIISKIDHNISTETIKVLIPFSEFVKDVSNYGLSWKRGKKQFLDFVDRLDDAKLKVLSGFEKDGQIMKNSIHIFSGVKFDIIKGVEYYEFRFNPEMAPVVSNLKSFTRLYSKDIASLSGKYTLDLFTFFMAIFSKQEKYKNRVSKYFSIDNIRERLSLKKNEYKEVKIFKRDLLDKALMKINAYSPIVVWYDSVREGRKIVGFKFYFVRNANYEELSSDFIPNKKQREQLKFYEFKAYDILKQYGVKEGIIFKRIIPNLPKGELSGREHYFIQFAIEHFESKTNLKAKKYKVGAFVNWFCKNETYSNEDSNIFVQLKEKVIAYTKSKASQNPSYFEQWNKMKDKTYIEVYGKTNELEF